MSLRALARTLLSVLPLTLVGAGLAAAVAAPPAPPAPPAAAPATLHVAVTGNDGAAGTAARPLRSIGRAVDRAAPGSTIVVHAGTYHEGFVVPDGKPLTILADGRVWLDGSRVVKRWRAGQRGFVSRGWTVRFDHSPTYHWGEPDNTEPSWQFVNPARPMAAHPDQVWVDGKPQRQVASLGQVRPGTFYVDEAGHRLHLGTNPRGKQVRASDIAKAISIRAAGTRISGINVRRFAPSVPHMGAVTAERDDVVLERMVIRDNATTGLHVMGADSVLRRVRAVRNGMLGMSGTHADDLRMVRVAARRNNAEGFNHSPVAGGVKIGRTDGVSVVRGTFTDNNGTGLWFDEGVRRMTVVDSLVRDNRHHGISLEISSTALVTDTVIAGNADNGIKVNNTGDVSLWNNTLVRNGRSINIVGDDRDPRLGPVQVFNNILSAPNRSANCLLCVEDYSDRFTAEQIGVTAAGNVYQRAAADRPRWAVVWSRGANRPATFDTVAEFRQQTGQEDQHLDLVGTRAVNGSYRPTAAVRKRTGIAQPIPTRLARIANVPAGGQHLGAWVD